jgi:DNA-binding NarL/FixJ family response regulator
MLDVLSDLYAAPGPVAFRDAAVAGLGRLIPCDLVAYNELDRGRRHSFALLDPPEAGFPGMDEVLAEHMDDNPLVTYHARTDDGGARMISDFITRRELHRRPLYGELFRYLGIEYQMVATLPTPPTLLVGIVFNRTTRAFSERERALLDLLRPHLVGAYETARMRATFGALEAALETADRGVVVLDRDERIRHATPVAERLLRLYFDGRDAGETLLPQAVATWLRGQTAQPLVVTANGSLLRVRVLPGDEHALVLESELVAVAEESLAPLGLTRRERQVLAAAASGRTNGEIASMLDISPRTVKKHLERVFDKLGVRTRTAAAAVAFRAARAA